MRVWNSLDEVPTDLPRTVVTLGNFDGVHRGHREVLRRVVERARARGALAVAGTAVLAVAVAAGLLASVLPARRAARLSPVAGLAAD